MDARGDLYAPFAPRTARIVAAVLLVVVAAACLALVAFLPSTAAQAVTTADRAGFVVFAALLGAILVRQAMVRAVPDDEGLTVRNLFLTRRVSWTEIVSVRFGGGRAWAQLDLDDGETLAVMAIQGADGARGLAESRRLAALVARHEPRPPD
ncbi:conserved hypothetical protein [Beutenbergia cavernae DSM 12333]|uniref:Low molecular weight protein antigen 6 PH domain-containing protein n=1 Tax=Beutenbergia cavernae (strain ATCC BAA-8 / DSM 12333 / CCUG 43141 / JCM 11478 / NBRC 16432 / NCIMB 13614 / HKI 0122) TaxID=471853 RepID=C5C6A4_BEUC1|nr:PH domain-containing protein [Beutenbergia cavernae]ACQ80310.1 conserved hypothetical protein [Beutenbergia cavernae DSM 12333]